MEFKWAKSGDLKKLAKLKVLSYWNLNKAAAICKAVYFFLKVLSYWNLNGESLEFRLEYDSLKYYHIGI